MNIRMGCCSTNWEDNLCESALTDSHISATSLPRLYRPLDRLTSLDHRHLVVDRQYRANLRTYEPTSHLTNSYSYSVICSKFVAPKFLQCAPIRASATLRVHLCPPCQFSVAARRSAVRPSGLRQCSFAPPRSASCHRCPSFYAASIHHPLTFSGCAPLQDASALASPQTVALALVQRTLIARRRPLPRFRSSTRLILLEAVPAYYRNRFPGFPSTAVDHRLL